MKLQVRGLSFDFWNTLAYPGEEEWRIFQRILASLGISIDERLAETLVKEAANWREREAERGRLWDRTAFAEFCRVALGDFAQKYNRLVPRMIKVWPDVAKVHLYKDVVHCLKTCKQKGIKMIVVSNSWSDYNIESLLKRLDIAKYFLCIVASGSFGFEKPDIRIFQRACSLLRLPPTDVAHVGDTYETDIIGARKAGLKAVLLDRQNSGLRTDCMVTHSLLSLEELL